jgi:hypothetical protein
MSTFIFIYLVCWTFACLVALVLYIRDKNAYTLSHTEYWRFLFVRWKVITFIIAATGMTVNAPYTGDPTWDYADALFMSVLTFLTAPWSIGSIYKVLKKEIPFKQGFVAGCLWMFSASWSYDFYLLIRDGEYPTTWFANIFASSALYILAGFLWNLEYRPWRGAIFSFMEADWPNPTNNVVFSKILWFALPIMALVTALILGFFWFR